MKRKRGSIISLPTNFLPAWVGVMRTSCYTVFDVSILGDGTGKSGNLSVAGTEQYSVVIGVGFIENVLTKIQEIRI
jgi:hypothetical protein